MGTFNRNTSRIERLGLGMPWEETHGYSQAFRVGDEIRISGQMPHDEAGELVGLGDPEAQAAAVFANLDRVLKGCGAARPQVVETKIYAVDLARNFTAISQAHREFFAGHWPASSAFGVVELVLPGQLYEVCATVRTDLPRG